MINDNFSNRPSSLSMIYKSCARLNKSVNGQIVLRENPKPPTSSDQSELKSPKRASDYSDWKKCTDDALGWNDLGCYLCVCVCIERERHCLTLAYKCATTTPTTTTTTYSSHFVPPVRVLVLPLAGRHLSPFAPLFCPHNQIAITKISN
ncbi:unnamed protein product [Caenorhabditis auriculariae]|uniref:Uncharacterized protein n=1 Tax=Caenorhabditis auriculariae TaxID=2777116 RepID=A0A8S1HEN7_9PELO|nr:unnamed protein product [Caenorhabditis auriculariae]